MTAFAFIEIAAKGAPNDDCAILASIATIIVVMIAAVAWRQWPRP